MSRIPLGALAERNFRLLFASTTVSSLGDGVSIVALAFAVLQISNSAVALGTVIAVRQVAEALLVLAGGVWSDRLPRHLVLVGAALTQGAAQAATAALLLSGHATVVLVAVLQAVYGIGDGFVIPASTGLVPQTVSAGRLQDANALLGLSRNLLRVLGPALGGVVVAVGSPGAAIAIDAASFVGAALLLVRLRPPDRLEREAASFLSELREGWREFTGRAWLWKTVALFGLGNMFGTFVNVLGPVIAKQSLGGAGPWGAIVSCVGAGSIVGGLVALRFRPARPLWWCVVSVLPALAQQAAIALRLPVPAIAACSLAWGVGFGVHLTLWFTVFQREVPAASISRVSAYDALGSLVLVPLGAAMAGPIAAALGNGAALLAAVGVQAACLGTMLLLPSVRAIRSPAPEPVPA